MSLFGPSKKEIWSQIAKDIGGDYVDKGFWKGGALLYEHNSWTITLDTYTVSTGQTTVTYTRMRAPFVNKGEFHFKITEEGFFNRIGKAFGMQDLEIGDPAFDDKYIIKSNDDYLIRKLLRNRELKQCFQSVSRVNLMIKDDEGYFGKKFPKGVDELYFCTGGIVKDTSKLKDLFNLFATTLDRLVEIDSAYDEDPKLELS